MADLAELLTPAPSLRLLFGQVTAIHGTYHDIAYGAGVIKSVAKLDADTYAVDDYVAFLLGESGALILGKQTPGTPPGIPGPPPPAQLIVDDNAFGTWDAGTGAWTASALVQGPTQYAAWFYTPVVFVTMTDVRLAAFEVEVTRTAGGPPEFVAHANLTGSGSLTLTGQKHTGPQPAVGTATWIPLPLDWGHQLVAGTIKGIAIGGGMNSGTYGGTGRLKFTPV